MMGAGNASAVGKKKNYYTYGMRACYSARSSSGSQPVPTILLTAGAVLIYDCVEGELGTGGTSFGGSGGFVGPAAPGASPLPDSLVSAAALAPAAAAAAASACDDGTLNHGCAKTSDVV